MNNTPANDWSQSEGMTLRDYFAAKAMQQQINNPLPLGNADSYQLIAKRAYLLADAMLTEREK